MLPTRRIGSAWADPFHLVHRNFDQALGRYFTGASPAGFPVDIREDEGRVYVEADLPGFAREDVNVTLENSVLTIAAKRTAKQDDDAQQHLQERVCQEVTRSFRLPKTIDENQVDAKLADGVLSLTLHKREEVKPRQIEVK
jgi:HSP20 family protein